MKSRAEPSAGSNRAGSGEGGPRDQAWEWEELAAAWGQSNSERHALRAQYAAVRDMIREAKDDPDLAVFDHAMTKVEKLHEQVQRPREQLADGEAVLDLANALVSATNSENREGPTPSQFVTALLRKFGGTTSPLGDSDGTFSWTKLGATVSLLFMAATGCQTMNGPMDLAIKEGRPRPVRKQSSRMDTARPEEIDELDPEPDERNDTDENMATMFGLLRRNRSAKLENLVLNRQSFAQTVENIFSLSFLVKDGRVAIHIDDNGNHIVIPKNAPTAELIASKEVHNSQFVFRFDFKDWEIMKYIVEPGNELMPHRNSDHVDQQKSAEPRPAGDCSRLHSDSRPGKGEAIREDLTRGRCGDDSPKRRKESLASRKLFSDGDVSTAVDTGEQVETKRSVRPRQPNVRLMGSEWARPV